MKKSVLVIIVGALALASCSQYTCPTYSKATKEKPASVKETRI